MIELFIVLSMRGSGRPGEGPNRWKIKPVVDAEHTTDDLVWAARAQSLPATNRLVVDWEELGLIDLRDRHPLGRGAGSRKGTWPNEQRNLFLTVLRKRQDVEQVATLCNIPVGVWLWWGDRYVPQRQVRRALETWTGRKRRVSEADARAAARRLVNDFGLRDGSSPRGYGGTALVDFIAEQLHSGLRDEPAWEEQIQKLGPGEARAVDGVLFAVTPSNASALLRARVHAVRRLQHFSMHEFEWARFMYLYGRGDYAAHQETLASFPRFGRLFTPEGLDDILNRACLDLITVLGLPSTTRTRFPAGDLRNPQTWTTDDLRAELSGTRVTAQAIELNIDIVSSRSMASQ